MTPVTFSAGIAAVGEGNGHGGPVGPIAVKAADALMYEAKAAGRDRVHVQVTALQGDVGLEGAVTS